MAIQTTIPWCDSTFNLMMGCNGCELWTKTNRECYAGNLTQSYRGARGWPDNFNEPKIFPERMDELKSWSDLTGQVRPDKPWIPAKLPRLIFLNDMGDTFTEALGWEWFVPYARQLEKLPHVFLLLSKRVRSMSMCFDQLGYVPKNFWVGTSITDKSSLKRVDELIKIPAPVRFLSLEPLKSPVAKDLRRWFRESDVDGHKVVPLHWLIVGGLSGKKEFIFQKRWAREILDICFQFDSAFFMKQMGGEIDRREQMKDFPADLQVRDFPTYEPSQTAFEW